MKTNILVVLGAPDPEMEAIESLLSAAGVPFVHATKDGCRVHPGNAYRSDQPTFPGGLPSEVWLVECGGLCPQSVEEDDVEVVILDHHRAGDRGYGAPPSEFFRASSLGQVISRLFWLDSCTDAEALANRLGWETSQAKGNSYGSRGVLRRDHHVCLFGGSHGDDGDIPSLWARVPDTLVLTAAADHCLAAAYRGECPGVDPDTLMRWRVASRAAFQGRPESAVLTDIENARRALKICQTRNGWADMRGAGKIAELPEAAARDGIPFLATVRDRDGREKFVLQAAPPELVSRFLAGDIVPGLVDAYGDPARGFAGGYLR